MSGSAFPGSSKRTGTGGTGLPLPSARCTGTGGTGLPLPSLHGVIEFTEGVLTAKPTGVSIVSATAIRTATAVNLFIGDSS
jgi:hypothetical protein